MQLIQLRHRATCSVCSSKLPPRSEAWYDEESKRTVCPTCQRIAEAPAPAPAPVPGTSSHPRQSLQDQAPPPPVDGAPVEATPVDPVSVPPRPRVTQYRPDNPFEDPRPNREREGLTGEVDEALVEKERLALRHAEVRRLDLERAARAELERAHEAREMDLAAAADHGPRPEQSEVRLSPPLPAPAPEPRPAGNGRRRLKLPQVGPSLAAEVEAKRKLAAADASASSISRALEAARPHGLEIIHSRPWGGTQVENESIVVAPSGIWVVDGIGDADKPVEKGFLGGHAGSELLNVVGGRTSLISGLLFDSPFQRVPVRGALVFEASPPGWFDGPFNLAGIAVTTPKDLIDSLFTPLHLDADTRRRVAEHLLSRF
ncbi:MAG: hypothetical protein H6519_00460 [Microthrixaceae bacterium]|nr:hypothetical protein [Acidimicrobiales bacterium]MCB9402887.1 hypothetical protein [Microthrixaceae bacterium]